MEEWCEDVDDIEAQMEDEQGCDYGVSELCSEPDTKDMGLCTTECRAYMDSVKKENEETDKK